MLPRLLSLLALVPLVGTAAADTEETIHLIVRGDLDAADLGGRLDAELGIAAQTVAPGEPCPTPCLDITISSGQATVVFAPLSGPVRSRAVPLGADPAQWPVLVTLLAGNLVRDEAAALLAELPPEAPPPPPPVVIAPRTVEVAGSIERAPAEQRFFVLGLVPFISTDLGRDRHLQHSVAISAVAGVGAGVRGISLAGAADVQTGEVYGAQIGGAVAVARHLRGIQIGGAVAAAGDLSGIQIGGAVAATQRSTGLQIGGAVSYADELGGVQIAGALSTSRRDARTQVGGAAALAGRDANVQVGGAITVAGRDSNTQVAGAANITGGTANVQVAGALNVAGRVKGLQLGTINVAKRVEGVQLGVINVGSNDGLSLGLINIVPGGRTDFEAMIDSSQMGAVLMRHGSRRWHNVYGIAGHTVDDALAVKDDDIWMYGFGFGPTWYRGATTVDAELMYWQVNEGASHRTDLSILGQLRLSVAQDLGPVSIVVGGALNAYITSDSMAPLLVERRGMPGADENDVTVEVWPSAFVGVRL